MRGGYDQADVGPVPEDCVDDHLGDGVTRRAPIRREVDDGGRQAWFEEEVAGDVAVDELRRRGRRSSERSQVAKRRGDRSAHVDERRRRVGRRSRRCHGADSGRAAAAGLRARGGTSRRPRVPWATAHPTSVFAGDECMRAPSVRHPAAGPAGYRADDAEAVLDDRGEDVGRPRRSFLVGRRLEDDVADRERLPLPSFEATRKSRRAERVHRCGGGGGRRRHARRLGRLRQKGE